MDIQSFDRPTEELLARFVPGRETSMGGPVFRCREHQKCHRGSCAKNDILGGPLSPFGK